MLAFRPDQADRGAVTLNAVPGRRAFSRRKETSRDAGRRAPLLRIAPFPGSTDPTFACSVGHEQQATNAEVDRLIDAVRSLRVGGAYWGSQPQLPGTPYTLVRVRDPAERTKRVIQLAAGGAIVTWLDSPTKTPNRDAATVVATGTCDPWHLLKRASRVIVDSDDELALIAAIAGVPVECVGSGRFSSLSGKFSPVALRQAFREHAFAFTYLDPYSGKPIELAEAIEYCGFWRGLVDSNRDISAAVGFAFWKRETVAPLLWRGSDSVPFLSNADGLADGERIAIWRARTSTRLLSELQSRGARLIEVEDGFIRSVGLGADCVPPLSIVVDRLGVHFDPDQPSELEDLLQSGDFPSEMLDRARRLRELIVESGLSKYSAGHAPLERRVPDRRHVLVPGQVEDDRAVIVGGAGLTSNLELLRWVRAEEPDAYLIYKPHPDIEAGHRKGTIPDDVCLSVADEIVRDKPISALLEFADEVHVNTSLAGFEALLRNKPVTTHGVPFYAGWGVTRDLGSVPARRSAKRTLDELVAAVLLVYPRYLDPLTGLPCPAEVLVRRLAAPTAKHRDGIVVQLRRLQGRCRRGLAALRPWR